MASVGKVLQIIRRTEGLIEQEQAHADELKALLEE